MKSVTATTIVVFVALVSFAEAQTMTTNQVTEAEAIKLASHLRAGMREEAATTFLERRGLKTDMSFGDSFGWYHCFSLSNKCSLILDIKPKRFRPDGAWADGLVQKAFIQQNGTNKISISLTNAP